jgi:hypothetical protein
LKNFEYIVIIVVHVLNNGRNGTDLEEFFKINVILMYFTNYLIRCLSRQKCSLTRKIKDAVLNIFLGDEIWLLPSNASAWQTALKKREKKMKERIKTEKNSFFHPSVINSSNAVLICELINQRNFIVWP